VSWLFIALLAAALAVLVTAEWPRISSFLGRHRKPARMSRRRSSHLKVVPTERDEFAASVRRDLDRLPTIEEREHRP
jgi:hypothetical protein